jgi:hypothetical protein
MRKPQLPGVVLGVEIAIEPDRTGRYGGSSALGHPWLPSELASSSTKVFVVRFGRK